MAEFVEVMKQYKRMCSFNMKKCCDECELNSRNNSRHTICSNYVRNYYEEAEEIIIDWAKEHPTITNADKFKDIYGFEISEYLSCPAKGYICNARSCTNCEHRNFWNQEYKDPKEN